MYYLISFGAGVVVASVVFILRNYLRAKLKADAQSLVNKI